MADSDIEWTDKVWNPVRGCVKVSPGCAHCYAETFAERFRGVPGHPYEQGFDLRLVPEQLAAPLRWNKPRRVFVNSMSDLFQDGVPDSYIDQVFAVMALARRHTFQVLTKRPERMRGYLSALTFERLIDCCNQNVHGGPHGPGAYNLASIDGRSTKQRFVMGEKSAYWPLSNLPLPNVWLGVSVENQHFADERIPLLLQTPAAVRFISAEPLLGPVDVKRYVLNATTHHVSADVQGMLRNRAFEWITGDDGQPLTRREAEDRLFEAHAQGVKRIKSTDACVGFSDQTGCPGHTNPRLDWVIVGGESGPGARPFDVLWARSIVQQCQAAGVPVFVKQLGAHPIQLDGDHVTFQSRKGGDPSEWPEDLRVREYPEARA